MTQYDLSQYSVAELRALMVDMVDQNDRLHAIMKLTRKDKAQLASNDSLISQASALLATMAPEAPAKAPHKAPAKAKARKAKAPASFVFYRGPSALDGAPIVAIATLRSRNDKTSDMVQTWIMRDDVDPINAARTGRDSSICGDCKHRGKYEGIGALALRLASTRSCYVQLQNAPLAVWKTRNKYRDLTGQLDVAAEACAGRMVRLGSYGDPTAVPYGVWVALLAHCAGHTGYTHQWRSFPEFAAWCMASCDTSEERVHAKALGFRTFRVAPAEGWTLEGREALCPASAEAGKKTNCQACHACGGTQSKARVDIMIPAHGGGKAIVTGVAA